MRVRKLALAAAIVVSGIAGHASADQPGSDWMTKEQVMQKLREGKGTKNGKIMEFHVDPHSGALTKEEVDD